MNQQQVWDKLAESWSKFRKNAPIEVINFLKNKEGKVLDLGCGSGRNFVKKVDIEYFGVDFSQEMIRLAQKTAERLRMKVKLKVADATNLPFEDNFFDTALFISSLHCIEGEDNRRRALEELHRVMKEGSEAMITVWDKNTTRRLSELEEKEGIVNWKKEGINHERYYYFYEKKELKNLLEEVGFEIIDISSSEDREISKKNIIFYVKKLHKYLN